MARADLESELARLGPRHSLRSRGEG